MTLRDQIEAALADSKARLSQGLTEQELREVEQHFGFRFAPDHRLMLSIAMPVARPQDDGVGHDWPDWRNDDETRLRQSLDRPLGDVLTDIEAGHYWPQSWPARPASASEASKLARELLAEVPPLVPLTTWYYVPSQPHVVGNPVVSTHGRDTVFLRPNLIDFLRARPALSPHAYPCNASPRHIPFWSDVVAANR